MFVGQSWIPVANGGSVRRSHSHAVGRTRYFAMPPGYQKGVSAGVNAASGLLGLSLPILLYANANCNRQFPKLCSYFVDRSVFARAAARFRNHDGSAAFRRRRHIAMSFFPDSRFTEVPENAKRSRICGSSR